MKKLLSLLFTVLCLGACMENELQPEYYSDSDTLYASMESIDATRTSMDEYNNVLWSENDQLIAFMKTTLGIKYQIKEQYAGTTTGGFSKVQDAGSGDDLESGQEIDHNVVLYPHSDQVWCMKYDNSTPAKAYKLNVVLPETQAYAENSFGNGAFPMVAVSTNNQLTFKNICGGLKLQFKGVDKIKSIKLEGLGNEAISGKSSVVAYADGSTPTITMAATASNSVILDCGDGVQLSESTPTTFIIAVPPVTFSSGMKITITDTDGLSKTLTNSSSNTIKRSSLLNFPVITYKQNGVLEFSEGAVTSYELPAEGGTIEIPVVTNLDYEVVIPEDAADWISVVETRALRQEVITLNISENATAEERSAEVLITTTSGTISQLIAINQLGGNPPQPGDYVDEYGINHGQGVKIGEVIWAPVNCGYHATDFKYGKLYQWGRKYGQGYDGVLYVNGVNVGTYSDEIVPTIQNGGVSVITGNDKSKENIFYKGIYDNEYNWVDSKDAKLWNSGTESNPVKTEYDPCPAGWRVPTYAELKELQSNMSSWTTNSVGQEGFYFSGASAYTDQVSQVFFPAAGRRDYDGKAYYRGDYGTYWSSRPISDASCRLIFLSSGVILDTNCRAAGYSVRCVQDSNATEHTAIDLSVEGTANSYIVSQAGTYKFTPTKGNSNESVGAIASVEVLWETFGTDVTPNVGDLLKNVKYENGVISFETPSAYKEGNAVIAAKDANGTILWSWHIWLTDQPEGQVYYNNAGTMMDRNLGATSATPGDVGALGLLYQWGRKDPFLNLSSVLSDIVAKSTITWPSAVTSNSSNGTIAYATANPTTFITWNTNNYDWYYTISSSTDNIRWTDSISPKSIYDPCPAGWRVPDGGSNGVWSKACGSRSSFNYTYNSTNEGMNFSGKFGSASTIWYPASGARSGSDGSLYNVGSSGYYWSASPNSYCAYNLFFKYSGLVDPTNYLNRAYGQSVRCLQE